MEIENSLLKRLKKWSMLIGNYKKICFGTMEK
jgi:hypothetical protein